MLSRKQNNTSDDSLFEELGIKAPESLPDCGTVDTDLLQSFLRSPEQLSANDQRFVLQCLTDFAEWREAAVRLIEARKGSE